MRYAIRNETFEGWDHRARLRVPAGLGYQGLEVAPFTLAGRVTDVTPGAAANCRRQAEDRGLTLLGLYWACSLAPRACNSRRPTRTVRQATADYLGELARPRPPRRRRARLRLAGPVPRPRRGDEVQAADYAVDTFRRARLPSPTPASASAGTNWPRRKPTSSPPAPKPSRSSTASTRRTSSSTSMSRRCHRKKRRSPRDPSVRRPHRTFSRQRPQPPRSRLRRRRFHADLPVLLESGYQGWVSVDVFDDSPDPGKLSPAKACGTCGSVMLCRPTLTEGSGR